MFTTEISCKFVNADQEAGKVPFMSFKILTNNYLFINKIISIQIEI